MLQHLGLYDGIATLTISLPENSVVGQVLTFETEIKDECILDTFPSAFEATVCKAAEPKPGEPGGRHKPIDQTKDGKQKQPSGFLMPNVNPVYKDEWGLHDMNRLSALDYKSSDEGDDYYLNMDNDYLRMELKGISDKSRIELTKARFLYSMALIGMSVVSNYKNQSVQSDNESPVNVPDQVRQISTMIAPVLIPMLDSMAGLTSDDVNPTPES